MVEEVEQVVKLIAAKFPETRWIITLQLCLRVESSFWWVLTLTGRKLVKFYPQSEESYVLW